MVRLKLDGFDAEFCPEYARHYLRRSGPPITPFEQFTMLSGSSDREDELDVHRFSVCDSASFVAEPYFSYMLDQEEFNSAARASVKMERARQELHRLCRKRLSNFDHIFFVPVVESVNPGRDATRIYNDHRHLISKLLQAYLDNNHADYYTVNSSSHQGRLRELIKVLRERGALDRE